MCVIIDINAIPSVFNSKSSDHAEFKPVFNWIIGDIGFMIYGGSKYKLELKELKQYLGFILELKRMNKVKEVNECEVDNFELEIRNLIPDEDFDDPHIAAIVKTTGCQLICSKDTRSIRYIHSRELYNKNFKLPKFYTSSRNTDLLCVRNIPDCYKHEKRLNKAIQEQIFKKQSTRA